MNTNLKKIIQWVSIHSPATIEHLNPPAQESEITLVENMLKISLPDSFKDLLETFNGEDGLTWLALFGDGNQLLSCRDIIDQYKLEQDIGQQMFNPEMENIEFWRDRVVENIISVKGAVKPLLRHQKWIPITCMNGDVFIYLDFDPAPGGHIGQVIKVDTEACSYQVLANSFAEFMEIYANQLANDEYRVDEDGFIESLTEDEQNWGVPKWLM